MPYILIEGYMCERCGYRWAARSGTGYRPEKDPKVCPVCKSPYWNKPRKLKSPGIVKAARWDQARDQESGREAR